MSLVERCRHPHVFGRFCHIKIIVKKFWCTRSFPPASEFPPIDVSLVSPQGERVLLCPRPLWHDTCSLLSYLAHICTPARLVQRGEEALAIQQWDAHQHTPSTSEALEARR